MPKLLNEAEGLAYQTHFAHILHVGEDVGIHSRPLASKMHRHIVVQCLTVSEEGRNPPNENPLSEARCSHRWALPKRDGVSKAGAALPVKCLREKCAAGFNWSTPENYKAKNLEGLSILLTT
jgi:hypothetical protein